MKLRARVIAGRVFRRLRAADASLRDAATEAAARALKEELTQRGEQALAISLRRGGRAVGTPNADAAARELGTLSSLPSPWLAPALPTALEPMRAAAKSAVARAVSRTRNGKK